MLLVELQRRANRRISSGRWSLANPRRNGASTRRFPPQDGAIPPSSQAAHPYIFSAAWVTATEPFTSERLATPIDTIRHPIAGNRLEISHLPATAGAPSRLTTIIF